MLSLPHCDRSSLHPSRMQPVSPCWAVREKRLRVAACREPVPPRRVPVPAEACPRSTFPLRPAQPPQELMLVACPTGGTGPVHWGNPRFWCRLG